MGYPDECGDMDELNPSATVICENCDAEFTSEGDWDGDGRNEPREFEPDEKLCERCREREQEMDVAFVLTPGGRIYAAPKPEEENGTFSLKQLQKIVGGDIEIKAIGIDSIVMVMNEDAYTSSGILRLPVNQKASILIANDIIRGRVLVCTQELID